MACSGNSATVDENICTNATTCPDAAQVRYWLYEAIGSPTSHGPWRRLPSQCLDPGPADPSPPAAPKDIP
jgi:hypothetical protein